MREWFPPSYPDLKINPEKWCEILHTCASVAEIISGDPEGAFSAIKSRVREVIAAATSKEERREQKIRSLDEAIAILESSLRLASARINPERIFLVDDIERQADLILAVARGIKLLKDILVPDEKFAECLVRLRELGIETETPNIAVPTQRKYLLETIGFLLLGRYNVGSAEPMEKWQVKYQTEMRPTIRALKNAILERKLYMEAPVEPYDLAHLTAISRDLKTAARPYLNEIAKVIRLAISAVESAPGYSTLYGPPAFDWMLLNFGEDVAKLYRTTTSGGILAIAKIARLKDTYIDARASQRRQKAGLIMDIVRRWNSEKARSVRTPA